MSAPHVRSTVHMTAPPMEPKSCIRSEYASWVLLPLGRWRMHLPSSPPASSVVHFPHGTWLHKASPLEVWRRLHSSVSSEAKQGGTIMHPAQVIEQFSVPSRHSLATFLHWLVSIPASSPGTTSSSESSLLPPPKPEAKLFPLLTRSLKRNTVLFSGSPTQPFRTNLHSITQTRDCPAGRLPASTYTSERLLEHILPWPRVKVFMLGKRVVKDTRERTGQPTLPQNVRLQLQPEEQKQKTNVCRNTWRVFPRQHWDFQILSTWL